MVIVLDPPAIDDVAVSWLPCRVDVVDSRTTERNGRFDVVINRGPFHLADRTPHLTCPTFDVQHGVFKDEG